MRHYLSLACIVTWIVVGLLWFRGDIEHHTMMLISLPTMILFMFLQHREEREIEEWSRSPEGKEIAARRREVREKKYREDIEKILQPKRREK